MAYPVRAVISCVVLLATGCVPFEEDCDVPAFDPLLENNQLFCDIMAPPDNAGVDPFYQKFCSAAGIAILASCSVSDEAMQKAWSITVNSIVQARPDVTDKMLYYQLRIAIAGRFQSMHSMPNMHQSVIDNPGDYSDFRARGYGAVVTNPYLFVGEEHLLCGNPTIFPSPYGDQDQAYVFMHELSHAAMGLGLVYVDEDFLSRLTNSWFETPINNEALRLAYGEEWQRLTEHALKNPQEYWAWGVTALFQYPDRLLEHDPQLYALVTESFVEDDTLLSTCD